ncbi:MAG TPA: hypothetical protein VI873_04625 [Candidatus Peribacteraceae bacterium]|nr:hypothetical protein [Candidatus Peribacteraceae bacterium]
MKEVPTIQVQHNPSAPNSAQMTISVPKMQEPEKKSPIYFEPEKTALPTINVDFDS